MTNHDLVPPEKTEAVARALSEVFGATPFEEIRRLTGGHSPGVHVFRLVVHGRPYLLRIILRADDPTRHFTNMKAAAEAGLAPHVLYANVEDKISITDFVTTVPFPRADALVQLPALLRSLHSLPPFTGVPDYLNTSCLFLIHKGPALDGFIAKFQETNMLSKRESQELFALHAQIAAVYPHQDPDMVSSHNDLFKPDNILYDGNRVWLVDWEASFLNDRYADLAVIANMVVNEMVVNDNAEETAFLQTYFGQQPDRYQQARFFLMRQLAHVFYTLAFLFGASRGHAANETGNPVDPADFQTKFWPGEIRLDDRPTKIAYSRFHLTQLLQNTKQARFHEALKIVADGRPQI